MAAMRRPLAVPRSSGAAAVGRAAAAVVGVGSVAGSGVVGTDAVFVGGCAVVADSDSWRQQHLGRCCIGRCRIDDTY